MRMRRGLAVICLATCSGCGNFSLAEWIGVGPVVREPIPAVGVPVAHGERYTLLTGDVLRKDAAEGVLSNDEGGERVTAFSGTTDRGGSIDLFADGSFRYTPPAGFLGADHFEYEVSNALGASTGRVTIKVVPLDAVPVP